MTLDSILPQATDDCEIVVLDSGSSDATEEIVQDYAARFSQLRYIRQELKGGIDRDSDRIVQLARGEYCWLMSDDDLLKPGAVAAVLNALQADPTLVIVNMERRNLDLSTTVESRWLKFESNRTYPSSDFERLLIETSGILAYMCCVVIRRKVWLSRDRESFFGSMFIHVGVIFQTPLPGSVVVVAEPYIVNRLGNSHEWSNVSEIYFSKWPSVIESLGISQNAKSRIWNAEPWRSPRWLLLLRGYGLYSSEEYMTWIRPRLGSAREKLLPMLVALIPGVLVNIIFVVYYSVRKDRRYEQHLIGLSRFHLRHWRLFKS